MAKIQLDVLLQETIEVLESMAEIFYSMHVINLMDDTLSEYHARNEVKRIANHGDGASEKMKKVMTTVVSPEHINAVLRFTDLSTLADRMQNKKVSSAEFVGKNIGWFQAMFIALEYDKDNKPTKVLFTTRSIDEEKKEKEKLIQVAKTDELTRLYNRRTYEEDIYIHEDIPEEDEFIYISLDVNGLKYINDSKGHMAGDELIIGTCECMKEVLGPYGRLYRIGGDEFVAIEHVSDDRIVELLKEFDQALEKWSGDLVDNLSVSYGYVSKNEFPNASVRELSSIADRRMYNEKNAYYEREGMDRRGQRDAHRALCDLYTKILKINITEDTFQIINMDETEKIASKGFSNKISLWFFDFGMSGQVHKDDLSEYLEKTSLSYMQKYFKKNKTSHSIFYRRKYGDVYKRVMMEIIPADDYRDDNQSLYLYVKNIDK